MTDKMRADAALFARGLAESREKAKALVIAGAVFVDGRRCEKPSETVLGTQQIEVRGGEAFISRGGNKLQKALETFDIDLTGRVCIDVGASTGGFTDCMLRSGAAFVYAVDVGYGQLAWALRQDQRVAVMERTNARYLQPDMFGRAITFASADVSFISLKLILPAVVRVMTPPFSMAALIKPQFEAGRGSVGKNGVVRDASVHERVIEDIISFCTEAGLAVAGLTYSPIKGPKGNIEYLVYLKSDGTGADIDIAQTVRQAHADAK